MDIHGYMRAHPRASADLVKAMLRAESLEAPREAWAHSFSKRGWRRNARSRSSLPSLTGGRSGLLMIDGTAEA